MAEEKFCLRWNDHQSTVISVFDTLLENGTLVDCTLAAEGQYIKAHRVVLCACSPFLETLLAKHFDKHPILILNGVNVLELKSIIDYMYRGEVNITQDHLGPFLKAAKSLQIKGLSENAASGENDTHCVGSPHKIFPTSHPIKLQQPNLVPESSLVMSGDGSRLPSSKTRKQVRRTIKDQDPYVLNSDLNNVTSSEIPCKTQTVYASVPNILATSSIKKDPTLKNIMKSKESDISNKPDPSSQKLLSFESSPSKEKLEPSTPLLVPKNEYSKESESEDSVEDLTLDDDASDEMYEMAIPNLPLSDISIPGPSQDNVTSSISYQRFTPLQSDARQLGMVFISEQETQISQTASQGLLTGSKMFHCLSCGKGYQHKSTLTKHQLYECGNKRPFACSLCNFTSNRMFSLRRHVFNKHKDNNRDNI